mmetsp:Transcript_2561/g.8042  ORF Transcript_2561/g.8042 Transcript_2561/m.8042 type:complete len:231 (+) Transcript_2561:364-1056(+)|eukprot:scaffold162244_cov32-Tisochrysis_lutea.AAC.4
MPRMSKLVKRRERLSHVRPIAADGSASATVIAGGERGVLSQVLRAGESASAQASTGDPTAGNGKAVWHSSRIGVQFVDEPPPVEWMPLETSYARSCSTDIRRLPLPLCSLSEPVSRVSRAIAASSPPRTLRILRASFWTAKASDAPNCLSGRTSPTSRAARSSSTSMSRASAVVKSDDTMMLSCLAFAREDSLVSFLGTFLWTCSSLQHGLWKLTLIASDVPSSVSSLPL